MIACHATKLAPQTAGESSGPTMNLHNRLNPEALVLGIVFFMLTVLFFMLDLGGFFFLC